MKLSDISDAISEVVSEAASSVVTIFTRRVSYDELLRPVPVTGSGSGFVVAQDGFVITNYHVVAGASEAVVLLPGGATSRAAVLAGDRTRDLALLKVDASGLRPARLGDSSSLRVGELVFAIGSPLGLPGPTVTMGIVSAVGRSIAGEEGVYLEDLIQTDAAINPGNSGGPLINSRGEVVGVTTAIIPYAQGVGFAIPVNSVKRFLNMVSRFGRAVTPVIGVKVVQLTPELSAYYGIAVDRGLMVVDVVPGSPADEAGLAPGDVIVEAGGRELRGVSDLRSVLEERLDKGEVELTIVRGGRRSKVRVGIALQ